MLLSRISESPAPVVGLSSRSPPSPASPSKPGPNASRSKAVRRHWPRVSPPPRAALTSSVLGFRPVHSATCTAVPLDGCELLQGLSVQPPTHLTTPGRDICAKRGLVQIQQSEAAEKLRARSEARSLDDSLEDS